MTVQLRNVKIAKVRNSNRGVRRNRTPRVNHKISIPCLYLAAEAQRDVVNNYVDTIIQHRDRAIYVGHTPLTEQKMPLILVSSCDNAIEI